MRNEILASYCSKFSDPLAAFIYDRCLGWEDESSHGFGESWYRFGKRVLYCRADGFVELERFVDVEEAEKWCWENVLPSEWDAFLSYDPGARGGVYVSCGDIGRDKDGLLNHTYPTMRRAVAALRLAMYRNGVYPNVWIEGEHGPSQRSAGSLHGSRF